MFDLNQLQPEEKDKLLMELLSKYENEQQGSSNKAFEESSETPAQESDEQQDLEFLKPFADCIEALISKVEELEERVAKTESLVIDDLFGGIQKLYDENVRGQGIDELKSKYGDLFNPHLDALKEIEPDTDVYGKLHDFMSTFKQSPDYSDEMGDTTMKDIASQLAAKIAEHKASKGEAPVGGEAVEATSIKAVPLEVDGTEGANQDFLKKVKEMSKKNKSKNIKTMF